MWTTCRRLLRSVASSRIWTRDLLIAKSNAVPVALPRHLVPVWLPIYQWPWVTMKISTVWKLSKSHTAENIAHIIWEIFACESESVYGLLVLGDSLYIKVVDFRYLIQLNNNHCRHLANQYEWMTECSSRFMSVNHFPYLPIVTNPENNPCNQTVTRIATEIWTFVHLTIANLPWKFHANPCGVFEQSC